MAPPDRAGLVLAGGYSTRYTRGDKILAEIADRPLLSHAIEGLAPAVSHIVVSCREEQLEAIQPILDSFSISATAVTDENPDRGPVAGLATALDAVEAPWVALVAADMPFVDPDFLEELFTLAEDGDGAVPVIDGHWQSTHAVYRTTALEDAAEAVRAVEGSLQDVLDQLEVRWVPEAAVHSHTRGRTFFDVNTVEDLREVRTLVEDDDTSPNG